jgi:aromatic ring hydroxylase
MGPQNTQTGPALRQDLKTIQKHFDLITDQDIKKLYLNLSTSIQKKHEQ